MPLTLWVHATALLFCTFLQQGSAQTVPCFTGLGCGSGSVGLQVSVRDCCSMADTLSLRRNVGSESCSSCYGFGWVQNISSDLTSAEPQTEVTAVEGQTVTLTLFYTKNNPQNFLRIDFKIQTSGSATDGVDYVVTPDPASVFMDEVSLQFVPVTVNVTLASDGIGGEGTEDIVLTLVQLPPIEPERVLINPTVRIIVEDNDIQTGFRMPGDGCIPEGVLQEICLTTVGSPAVDTVLTVSVTYGTAGPEDFDLITTQVTIETMTEPCVRFQAIADGLGLEGVENLTLSLSGPPNVQLTTASLHICIQDSDVVVFEFFAGEAEADESDLEINVTITKSVATPEEVSFTLTPTEYDASFGLDPIPTFDPSSPNLATPGADYVPDVIQFTIPPGDGPTIISVPIFDDVIAEDSDQYFIGVLGFSGNPTGAVLGRDAILLGIQDNDQAIIRFQFLLSVVDEQDVDFTHNLLVTRDVDSEQNYSIALSGSPNTAEDDDFFVSDDTFYFPPDVSSVNVSVTIRGDTRIELAETFDVRLRQSGGPNFVVDPLTRNIIVEIRDNDGDYIYIPAQSTYTVPEGEQREVSFVLDNPPPDGVFEFDYNVILSTADGTATGGSDYMSIVDEVIAASTMPNGVVSVNVNVFSDDRVELEETFSVVGRVMESGMITDGIGREFPVVFQGPLDVSIISDDAITIGFEDIEYTVDEGGTLEVVVVKSAPFDSVIEFEVAGGSFSAVRAFPDGASSPKSISIFFTIPDDVIALEPPETISFTLTVLDPNPQISVDPGTTTVTILDNDLLGQEFVCYESTECHGAVVETDLPLRGDCCGGRGLSFSLSGDTCRNCFSMEEFCNDGSEFYVAFFSNIEVSPLFSLATIMVKIDNMEDFQQTVAYSYKSETKEREIGPRSSVELSLPPEMRFGDVSETDKGVFIQSIDGAKLSVTAFGAEYSSSDTYQLLPCVYLPSNYEYYAVSVAKEIRVLVEEGEEFILPPTGNSAIVLIASEERTTVTITPSQDVEIIKGTTTPAGTLLEQTLGKGKAVFLSSPEDLTGTRVVSDKPLAFYSGHECGNMPFDLKFCDHMVEQILPTSTWGTEFYTASFMTRSLDRFRALTSRDDNSIRWVCTGENPTSDGRSLPTAGNFTEFEILANRFCRFTSIYPVLLAQFSIGGATSSLIAADPSMTIIPPAGQYKDSYMLNYFSGQIVTNFVNIFLLASPGITTDGVSLDKGPISGTWTGISCEEGGNEVCAYGIQVKINEMEPDVVPLDHSNPDAKLLGISYSTDIRTSRASHSGMTQKPIALDTVSLSASEYSVEEGSGEVVISISRTGDLLDDITVLFAAGEIPGATSAAIAGEDFTEARRAVLLPAGVTSVTQTVALGPDNIFPGEAKVFEVYLGPAPGAFVSPTALANVTITDGDPPLPVMNITLSQTSYAISEGSGYFEIILVKTDGARGPVTVSVTPINGTALASTDFELNQMDITFRISEREKVVPVRIINDDIAERSERFTVMIQPVEGLFRVAVLDNLTTVDIIDDDRMLMAFMPSEESPEIESVGGVTESVGMINVDLVVIKGAIDHNVTVLLMTNPQDGDTAFEGEDYEVIERGLTIDPTTTRIPFRVEIIDDSICEDKEVFSLSQSLTSDDDPISIVNDIRITIADADDCLPVVRMTVEPTVVSEAGEIVEVTVSLAGGGGNLPGEVQLGISTVPIQPKDIDSVGVEILTQSEVTLAFEEGSSSRQLQIGVRDNSVYDGGEDRIFAVTLSLLYTDFENLNISSDYVEVRITDDEPQPEGIVCNVRGEPVDAPTAEVCCVDLGGMSYEKSIYTIPCIVIGFQQTEYEVVERSESYQFTLAVVQGSLAQNLTLTIISTPITAAANDYRVLEPWVPLEENGTGTVQVEISTEPGQEDGPRETFRLTIIEESGVTPKNVFFRGALVTILDQPSDLP